MICEAFTFPLVPASIFIASFRPQSRSPFSNLMMVDGATPILAAKAEAVVFCLSM